MTDQSDIQRRWNKVREARLIQGLQASLKYISQLEQDAGQYIDTEVALEEEITRLNEKISELEDQISSVRKIVESQKLEIADRKKTAVEWRSHTKTRRTMYKREAKINKVLTYMLFVLIFITFATTGITLLLFRAEAQSLLSRVPLLH